jgi:dGTPase
VRDYQERLRAFNALLAPYAIPHDGQLGRPVPEEPDATRFPFQRDRDRIIHSEAFRRLKGKTQVFVAGEGDHYRTRLTHTMEVAQISRDIARTLSLNEDLAECVALAHDLGHPPFGHRGEAALDAWMREHGEVFEHNTQSLRIVTLLAEHATHAPGLNLDREVIDGLRKHTPDGSGTRRGLSLEAQTVNIADEIAYLAHDCEDGLRAGLFGTEDVADTALGADALHLARTRGTALRGALIHLLVSDLYAETQKQIALLAPQSPADVYAAPVLLARFSPGMLTKSLEMRRFLLTRMYEHPRVLAESAQGQAIVRFLCERYFREPHAKVLHCRTRAGGSLAEGVKDYVAGMTDAFAAEQARAEGM